MNKETNGTNTNGKKKKAGIVPEAEAVLETGVNSETETTDSGATSERRRFFNTRFMQDWKNFHFFFCDEQTRQAAKKLLVDRDYLLPSDDARHQGAWCNQEVITSEARYFAKELVERLKGNRDARKYGLKRIAENIETISAMQDLSLLYFYIGNLYASARWQMPYNLQRLPVNHDAFSMYLSVYTDTFISCVNEAETENQE